MGSCWTDFYSVQNKDMDGEHQLFLIALHNVYVYLDHGDPNDIFDRSMACLLKSARAHFDHEEQLLSFVGYPDLKQQKILHHTLVNELKYILISSKGESKVELQKHLRCVRDMFLNHIRTADLQYCHWIENQKSKVRLTAGTELFC